MNAWRGEKKGEEKERQGSSPPGQAMKKNVPFSRSLRRKREKKGEERRKTDSKQLIHLGVNFQIRKNLSPAETTDWGEGGEKKEKKEAATALLVRQNHVIAHKDIILESSSLSFRAAPLGRKGRRKREEEREDGGRKSSLEGHQLSFSKGGLDGVGIAARGQKKKRKKRRGEKTGSLLG